MLRVRNILKEELPYGLYSFGICGLYGLVVGLLIMVDPKVGTVAAVLPLLTWIALVEVKNCLYLLLAFTPFHASPFVEQNLMGIPGAKPFSLLAVLTLIVFFYHGGQLLQHEKTRRRATIYLGIYFAFFSLAMLRSLDYFQLLQMVNPDKFGGFSVSGYLLSWYVKPSLYLVSFIYILNHITSEKDIERIFTFLCVLLGVVSIAVVLIVFSHGDILMGTRSVKYWNTYFGYHYNEIGSFYIILGPLVIVPAVRKRFWGVFNWFLVLLGVVLLQSRTALLGFLLGNLLMLFCLGRKKELILLSSLFFICSLYFLPGFIKNTLQIGLESGDVNEIFSGRIDSIWVPLLAERFNDMKLLLLGKGFFSMASSTVYQKGIILQTGHPHNAFIEIFLDNGIILFVGFILLFVKFLKSVWHNVRKVNSDIGWALFLSIICYLISCLSGRSFYPEGENMFLFAIIALLINYFSLGTRVAGDCDYSGPVIK